MYRAGERTRFTRNLGGGRSLNRVARNTIQRDVSGRQGSSVLTAIFPGGLL